MCDLNESQIDELLFLKIDIDVSYEELDYAYVNKELLIVDVTLKLPYEQRSTIFGDPLIANAMLDRLLHHSHIVSIVGPSYRIKDVMDSFEN